MASSLFVSGARHWAGVSFTSTAPLGVEGSGAVWPVAPAADGVWPSAAGKAPGVSTALPRAGLPVRAGAV
ncbi:hypothetical protein, partial [Aeromonas taiwanensis]|uniref:hypothetical protein n=1 Tax=Aeromonas taiwanensis TaxID=633417 RepID=UPI003BA001E3